MRCDVKLCIIVEVGTVRLRKIICQAIESLIQDEREVVACI